MDYTYYLHIHRNSGEIYWIGSDNIIFLINVGESLLQANEVESATISTTKQLPDN